ncbi:CHAT domain protein [Ceratobasidium sp. AG-Ba]|nr:CHAT domain protein [Ceratobasidium sp. AG-Ba]
MAKMLLREGALLGNRFLQSRSMSDIDMAIESLSRALKLSVVDDTVRRACLGALATALESRFIWSGAQEDVEDSIHCWVEAIELIPDDHLDSGGHWNGLGMSWLSRYERLGELADLDHAMGCLSKAVDLTPDGHPDKPSRLNNLGNSWSRRYERLGELADLDLAMGCLSKAVDLTPDGHPGKPSRLSNLGSSWFRRYERLGELADLDHAMGCLSKAVDLTPDGHLDKPGYLNNLGSSWLSRYERLGELADLDHAMGCLSKAVDLTPDGHPNKPSRLSNLGNSCLSRYERLGELADLDHAMGCLSKAVDLTPDGHPDKPSRLNNLGNSWSRRHERLGELADLDHAMGCLSKAVDLTPDGHLDKPGYLNNLGSSWSCRYQRLGELADLDHAMGCLSKAVDLTPDGHPNKPSRLSNLGNSWSRRYERLGELADLDHAMGCLSKAVDLSPDSHLDKPSLLNNLGTSWFRRYERLGELADLDHAMGCLSKAVDLTPDGHPNKPSRLSNLGNSWSRRYERLGELADLDHAMGCLSKAVDLSPDSHLDKPSRLSNLGTSWFRRYERLGELADLDHAMGCLSKAVDLSPDSHLDKPILLSNLGNAWSRRYERLGEPVALENAFQAFRAGATCRTFNPSAQMQCARGWAAACILLGRFPLDAYQTAFSLLPRFVWIGQTTRRRHETMVAVRDLAAEAASWAISASLYDLALEWLEQGRSIVWGQTLQLRTPYDELFLADPLLAERLQRISSQLDIAAFRATIQPSNTGLLTDIVSEGTHHHALADEWDRLLGEARKLAGFENFLLPVKSNELKQTARHGPVVVINTHLAQCDALIILPQVEDIIHVPLTTVRQETLDQFVADSKRCSGRRGDLGEVRGFTRSRTKDGLQLATLMWSDIVEPVLKRLRYTGNVELNELPHVTWCTTGTMSQLPLHVAGPYNGITPGAVDLIVSSYTPTLTALLWHKGPSSSQVGLLAVGQQASPGQNALPNTVEELKAIRKYSAAVSYCEVEGSMATTAATLTAMEESSWVHLACHANQDRSNPSQSAFHLHDGPLTLEAIARRQFKNKGLAFLSACQTATGDETLPDEATHLAAGMLIAGYPSVIGTIWSIEDEDAPVVAEAVYSELLKDGKMDHTRSARALHKAVKVLREKYTTTQ